VLIALIVLGPKDMAKAGGTIGRFLRKTILSPTWVDLQRKIRTLPNQLMREAGIEEEDLRMDRLNMREQIRRSMTLNPQESAKAVEVQPQPVNPPDTLGVPSEWTSQPVMPPETQPASAADELPAEWTSPVTPLPDEPPASTLPAAEEDAPGGEA
jgi:Sec-independent protein translocase protein TatA